MDSSSPMIQLHCGEAFAPISLHGGQVIGFTSSNSPYPVLWLSPDAIFQEGTAIRGGIPICWPWFYIHPEDPTKPNHGFARTAPWEATDIQESHATLRLQDPAAHPHLWNHPCEVTQHIVLTETSLSVQLTTKNTGKTPFTIGGGLHTYLHIGDITKTTITDIGTIDQPIDIELENTTKDTLLHDPTLSRTLRIARQGSHTIAIWNPWKSGAATIQDFPNKAYQEMVCIESVNTGKDTITLAPGKSHTLGTIITVEPESAPPHC